MTNAVLQFCEGCVFPGTEWVIFAALGDKQKASGMFSPRC